MGISDGLIRIFWPLEATRSETAGVLVGWRNSGSDILVTAILLDAEPKSVENALRIGTLFRGSPHPIGNLLRKCGPSPLQVLGVVNPKDHTAFASTAYITMRIDVSTRLPCLMTPAYDDADVQIIMYSRPQPLQMQFMSPYPISLALGDKHESTGLEVPPFKGIDEAEKAEDKRKEDLVQKLKLHTVKTFPQTEKEVSLALIIFQINCSNDIDSVLQKNAFLVRPRSRRTLSVSQMVVESANNIWDYVSHVLWNIFTYWIWPIATQLFILGLLAHRVAGEGLVRLAEWRVGPRQAALKDISATAQQIDLRLQQFCYWPVQYLALKERKGDWESISNKHSEYIRFYNSLWLVANDIIIGIAVGAYIIENADAVAGFVDKLISSWSLEGLRRILSWLMVYPAGLKLNNELAGFLGDLFIWVIDYWGACIGTLQPHFPQIVRFCGFASFAGATMPLSLASDMLSLCMLHIYCFYVASARIYGWQLSIISSLFHLFRGKKRNVLRNRIDSCDYELDQLLLGTILFTVLFFLLPTVVVFYLTFAIARMGIICSKAILDTLLACLNHFPLFALMLRAKDPGRLPGGIRFELQDTRSRVTSSSIHDSRACSIITLKSVPLSLAAMFHEYAQLGGQMKKHYLSSSVLFSLATGGFIPPLHRKNLYSLQYSMLPATRISIPELWRRLHSTSPTRSHENGMSNGSAKSGFTFP